MNDREFKELIDLYLDKEIDTASINRLRQVIATDAVRLREFQSACQLHHAMRMALHKEVAENEARTHLPLRRWQVAVGMVASFILGAVLLAPAIQEARNVGPLALEILETSDSSDSSDRPVIKSWAVTSLKPYKPYANYLSRKSGKDVASKNSSLAGRLRLFGLSPDLAPPTANLEQVEVRTRLTQFVWDEDFAVWEVHTHLSSAALPQKAAIDGGLPMSDFISEGRLSVSIPENAMTTDPFQLESRLAGWLFD
jgi:hypothetical protein